MAAEAEAAMPVSHFNMWGMLILMALGAAMSGGVFHESFLASVRAAYPSESVKRQALRRCGQFDAEFSRFSEHDREICYRSILPASAQASTSATFAKSDAE
jgi:hypothetical protein